MDISFYIKDGDFYKQMSIQPPSGANWQFFKGIKLTIDRQLDIIREDILNILEETKENANLICPHSDNKDKQEKLNILLNIRTMNSTAKTVITEILTDAEFIICEHCRGKMSKIPLNESYEKIGHTYILKNVNPHQKINYIYGCENCVFAISEECYEQLEYWKKYRKDLISSGESYLPNEYGCWNWSSVNNKKIKSYTEEDINMLPRRRIIEKIIENNEEILKITDVLTDGTIINIK